MPPQIQLDDIDVIHLLLFRILVLGAMPKEANRVIVPQMSQYAFSNGKMHLKKMCSSLV